MEKEVTTVNIDKITLKKAEEFAKKNDLNFSQVVRRALKEYLEKNFKKTLDK